MKPMKPVWICLAVLLGMIFATGSQSAQAQTTLDWEAAKLFQYNVISVDFDQATREVTVVFSVTNPTTGTAWDIKNDAPFTQSPALSRLAIDIGWATTDYTNTGSGSTSGAAYPISIDALRDAELSVGGSYAVTATLPDQATGTGVVAIEGHPASDSDGDNTLDARVPVKSVFQYFPITDSVVMPRREVVNITKCQACHNGDTRDGVTIPRLSLHGANRTEELGVCVICHNPNQTDIPYRSSGAEVAIDFKRMVHAIHAGGMRDTPLVITGFMGSINDYSHVRFPAELKNCMNCHVETSGSGTFELPLQSTVSGNHDK